MKFEQHKMKIVESLIKKSQAQNFKLYHQFFESIIKKIEAQN